jgi:aminopeptidase N
VLIVCACQPDRARIEQSPTGNRQVNDPHSYANIDEVTVSHLALDLEVDFESRRLFGSATLSLPDTPASRLVLDTRDLDIAGVTLDSGVQADFTLGAADPLLGRPLDIRLADNTRSVTVEYSTDPNAEALQWLTPEQTAGGDRPFLFSQSQAILARTWVPCQDSPAVRMTYDATIRVPPGLMAVMSAENGTVATADGVFEFSMRQPIPSYLLALAVGDLDFRQLGPRSGVYAEPSVVDAAAWEFADTEEMMATAERLYGPYPWERYDLLVLPPSFPFGGMENPRLTFATPTILAGDRSLVALVAHELAHSWSGNLVTNATWNDFWLNEGFTSYIENRLMEELYGVEYAEMLAALDLDSLNRALEELEPDSQDSHLVFDLAGRSPDDGMTEVAYNKGANFLRSLEYEVGRSRWDEFLTDYFATFAFQSIDTPTFLGFLRHNLLQDDPDLEARARVDEWVYGPGLPENAVVPEPKAFARVEEAIASWQDGTSVADLPTTGWTTHHWLHFLRNLPDELSVTAMRELDEAFAFTSSGNSEVLVAWLLLAIRHDYAAANPALEAFLTSVGRLKFLYPLYGALARSEERLDWARRVYEQARPGYHPVSIGALDTLLEWQKPGEAGS